MDQQETRLVVVKNWMTPAISAYDRIAAPVRVLGAMVLMWTVRIAKRVRSASVNASDAVATVARAFIARITRRIALVPQAEYIHLNTAIAQLEAQALIIATNLERRERQIKAFVGLARTLVGLGHRAHTALSHALSILMDDKYWTRKPGRVDSAMHYACAVADLAARSGESKTALDAYELAQQYGAKLDGHFRKIRYAVMMADIAGMIVPCDKPTWLAQALGIAIVIEDPEERKRAVSAVATKMVADGYAPPAEDVHVELLCRCAEYGDYAVPTAIIGEVPDEKSIDDMVDDAFAEHKVA